MWWVWSWVFAGVILTPMAMSDDGTMATPEADEYTLLRTPMKRRGMPNEVAAAISFLLSDDASCDPPPPSYHHHHHHPTQPNPYSPLYRLCYSVVPAVRLALCNALLISAAVRHYRDITPRRWRMDSVVMSHLCIEAIQFRRGRLK